MLTAADLTIRHDDEIVCPITFESSEAALRAFVGAGPTTLAIQHSGEEAVAEAVRGALEPFTGSEGRVTLPGWYRTVTV